MKEAISALAKRIAGTKLDAIKTEQATINAFVHPFLRALGYDETNTAEVNPEYTADVGIKQGERVDYVILNGGVPALLIECKPCHSKLSVENESQLIRYFIALKSKSAVSVSRPAGSLFAILTNGIVYKFFTDNKANPNILDNTPFFEIDLLKPENIDYGILEEFSKSAFNAETISTTVQKLKTFNKVRAALEKELADPSRDFAQCIFNVAIKTPENKVFNRPVEEKLRDVIQNAIKDIIDNKVKAKLHETLAQINKKSEELTPKAEEKSVIEPTQDETDAFNIIKAIVWEIADIARLKKRINKGSYAISFDNNRHPVCHLYFKDPNNKSIGLLDTDSEVNEKIVELNEIFSLKPRLLATVKKYLS